MNGAIGTVVLVGNAGVGKTTVFEQLAAGKVRIRGADSGRGNLAEATLSTSVAAERSTPTPKLVDTPGIPLLFSREETDAAVQELLISDEADTLLFVADAKNPRRSLILFLQLAELQRPTVFLLNMVDEARQQGLEYDTDGLTRALSVGLCETAAANGANRDELVRLLSNARVPETAVRYPATIETVIAELTEILQGNDVPPRVLALMLLTGNQQAEHVLDERFDPQVARAARQVVRRAQDEHRTPLEVVFMEAVSHKAAAILDRVTRERTPETGWSRRLGRLVSHPLWGIPFALLALIVGYLWVGMLGAGIAVDGLDQTLFRGILLPACERVLDGIAPPLIQDALLDENFGLLPTGLFLAVGIVFPVLLFFYTYFGALEDSGYLPRLSLLMDRFLRMLGLNGKGVLPLVFGVSCVTMAILTTRVLKSKKERIIASFLLLLSFPCAPLLAVMLLILSQLSWTAAATVFGLLTFQTLAAGVLVNSMMAKHLPDFILELPPLRRPRLRLILGRALRSSLGFLKEALPIFLLAALLMFVLDRLGALAVVEQVSKPVVNDFLGLPDEAIQVFIKTIIRRENGAAELTVVQSGFDSVQLVVTLFVMTVLIPCVNTTIVLIKEHGLKLGAAMLAFVCVYAVVVGAGLSWVCRATGITFT
jgi:ferrous iron transport protein B